MTRHHMPTTKTSTKQSMPHRLEVFRGKVLLSSTMVHDPMILQHGWNPSIQSGSEIHAYYSRTCWKILNLPSILTTHHTDSMIRRVLVVMRTSCLVIGHGNRL